MKAFIKASILFTLLLIVAFNLRAQSVRRDSTGNYFSVSSEVATKFVFTDKDGSKSPVFETLEGKAFIKRTSKKTGKEYRYYLKTESK